MIYKKFKKMKNLKMSLGALALFMGIFIFFAFKPAAKEAAKVETTYYFEGTSIQDANDADFWTDIPNSLPCETGVALPCQVSLNESIESYLIGKSDQDVMNDPDVSKRSE